MVHFGIAVAAGQFHLLLADQHAGLSESIDHSTRRRRAELRHLGDGRDRFFAQAHSAAQVQPYFATLR